MALSSFVEKSHAPTDDDLRRVLGRAYSAWTGLLVNVANQIGPITEVWKFTSASTGWGLRVVRKDRVILYMTPGRREFLVSFALGEKAATAAREAKLPATVLDVIDTAPRYAEGRGVRFSVRDKRPVAALARLAQIKSES